MRRVNKSLFGPISFIFASLNFCRGCFPQKQAWQRSQFFALLSCIKSSNPLISLVFHYEEKPQEPKGNLAVPPFYYYRHGDLNRIAEALDNGCGYDAPGSFAAWLSGKVDMQAWLMPGKRHDIGDMKSYEAVRDSYAGLSKE